MHNEQRRSSSLRGFVASNPDGRFEEISLRGESSTLRCRSSYKEQKAYQKGRGYVCTIFTIKTKVLAGQDGRNMSRVCKRIPLCVQKHALCVQQRCILPLDQRVCPSDSPAVLKYFQEKTLFKGREALKKSQVVSRNGSVKKRIERGVWEVQWGKEGQ